MPPDPEVELESQQDGEAEDAQIDLPAGNSLSPSEANPILNRGPAAVVLLAGEADAGKTTLLAALYEKFQEGPFQGHVFAGSKTLPGFEERCFLARVASGGSKPDTRRTALTTTPQMLHLRLLKAESRALFDLLAVDVAGERYVQARHNTEAWTEIPIMGSVSHFVFLIDGKRAANPTLRHEVFTSARQLLRSGLEAGVVVPGLVDFVVTKWDLVAKAGPSAVGVLDEGLARLRETLGDAGAPREIKTAARSENPEVLAGLGIPELFDSWVANQRVRPELGAAPKPPDPQTPFDRFGTTHNSG